MKYFNLLSFVFLLLASSVGQAQFPTMAFWNISNKAVFTNTGADQTFTVPSYATSITIKAWGAGGAAGYNGTTGGAGAYVTATFPVGSTQTIKPGDTLTIVVGTPGSSSQATLTALSPVYGGGGAGGRSGGSGGGRSSVSDGSTELLTAGGGGGGGWSGPGVQTYYGLPGGNTNGYGPTYSTCTLCTDAPSGKTGTDTDGGLGGTTLWVDGNKGTKNTGANAPGYSTDTFGPGGGGGGYWGGGSGAQGTNSGNHGPGGGGSSFVHASGTSTSFITANPIVGSAYQAPNSTDSDYSATGNPKPAMGGQNGIPSGGAGTPKGIGGPGRVIITWTN